jgi:hypothetical protein
MAFQGERPSKIETNLICDSFLIVDPLANAHSYVRLKSFSAQIMSDIGNKVYITISIFDNHLRTLYLVVWNKLQNAFKKFRLLVHSM